MEPAARTQAICPGRAGSHAATSGRLPVHGGHRTLFPFAVLAKGSRALDERNLLGLIEKGRLDCLPFETLAREFRMIDSIQMPVIIARDDEAQAALDDLEFADGCAGIARRLQPYLVQVPRKAYDALLQVGAIQPAMAERYGEQFMVLVNPDLYHDQFGLRWDNPAFVSSERLLW